MVSDASCVGQESWLYVEVAFSTSDWTRAYLPAPQVTLAPHAPEKLRYLAVRYCAVSQSIGRRRPVCIQGIFLRPRLYVQGACARHIYLGRRRFFVGSPPPLLRRRFFARKFFAVGFFAECLLSKKLQNSKNSKKRKKNQKNAKETQKTSKLKKTRNFRVAIGNFEFCGVRILWRSNFVVGSNFVAFELCGAVGGNKHRPNEILWRSNFGPISRFEFRGDRILWLGRWLKTSSKQNAAAFEFLVRILV